MIVKFLNKFIQSCFYGRSRQSEKNTFHYEFMYDQSFLEYPEDWITGSHLDDVYSILGEKLFLVSKTVAECFEVILKSLKVLRHCACVCVCTDNAREVHGRRRTV